MRRRSRRYSPAAVLLLALLALAVEDDDEVDFLVGEVLGVGGIVIVMLCRGAFAVRLYGWLFTPWSRYFDGLCVLLI